jgi:Kef-type K+ transport system membrane component KefB/nucleotide-binding universal stress UspA family protein
VSFDLPTLPLGDAGLVFAVIVAAILVAPMLARLVRLPEIVIVVVVGFAVGPTGLGLLERAGVVETLGTVGLLYLMFVAGLELDLDDFMDNRRDSVGFGAATFAVPMALGTLTALALGYDLLAALLLGSCWASHTLVTYPVFQRVGTVGNRAVATSVGATIITDTAALLVLAVVARAHQGELTIVFWATLLPSLVLLTAAVLTGLPRVTRWFFSGWGQDRSLRFLFVLVSLFVVASLFELIGIEAIVGAFLAGLALNRSVPNGGLLMERIDFLGRTLLIPLFLLATGMLIDLQVLTEPRTLLVGSAFTAVALIAKLLAAMGTGRLLRYSGPEIGAMFSLSAAQAAATLAAIVVGLNVGLLDESTVNAVMMVILITCLVAPAAATRYAPRLPRPESERDLGDVVVVPLVNPRTAPTLIRIASGFARADGGLVVPVMVVPSGSEPAELTAARDLEGEVTAVAQSAGAEARPVLRIDATPALGIAHTVAEQEGSLLVLGWTGETMHRDAIFGGVIDSVLSSTFVPTLVYHDAGQPLQRILVVVDDSVTTPAGGPALALATAAARVISRERGIPVEVVTNRRDRLVDERMVADLDGHVRLDPERRAVAVEDHVRRGDLLIVPTLADSQSLHSVAAPAIRGARDGVSLLVALDTTAAGPHR